MVCVALKCVCVSVNRYAIVDIGIQRVLSYCEQELETVQGYCAHKWKDALVTRGERIVLSGSLM